MNKKEKVLFTFNILITVLIAACLAFIAVLAVDFVKAAMVTDGDLGTGLTVAVTMIFMLLFGAGGGIVGVAGIVWSGVLCRKGSDSLRRFIKPVFIADMVIVAVTVLGVALLLLLYNLDAFESAPSTAFVGSLHYYI